MITSRDTEKAFDKISHPSLTKRLTKPATEGNILNFIKSIYETSTANDMLQGEKPLASFLRSVMRQGSLLSYLLFNITLAVLSAIS